MTENELELWNKISKFEFDRPGTTFTFAKRLATENGFSPGFALEIIDEYRRFIFLCSVSPHEVSPSYFVDLAWHLHLTYTRSYWIDLCGNTIGRELHHNPTRGGADETRRFTGSYQGTLAIYKRYFGSQPPRAIWPDDHHDPRERRVEVDASRNWVIPKPVFRLPRVRAALLLLATGLAAVTAGCTADVGSIGFGLSAVAVIGIIYLFARKERKHGGSSGCGSVVSGYEGDSSDSSDSADNCDSSGDSDCSDSGGDSGCSGGCGGGCGGGGD